MKEGTINNYPQDSRYKLRLFINNFRAVSSGMCTNHRNVKY